MTKFKKYIIMTNFWIKDQTRQKILTKAPIPNNGKFNIFANYTNLMDARRLGFKMYNRR